MKHWLAALCLSVAAILALPVLAPVSAPALAEEPQDPDDPGSLALDGIEQLMRALEAVVDMIPQYEMPEINEDGDIIIRRKRDVDPRPEADDEEPSQTQT